MQFEKQTFVNELSLRTAEDDSAARDACNATRNYVTALIKQMMVTESRSEFPDKIQRTHVSHCALFVGLNRDHAS